MQGVGFRSSSERTRWELRKTRMEAGGAYGPKWIRNHPRLPWRGTRFRDGTPPRCAAVFACRTRHYVRGCIAS